jgi:hypothetical protein
VIEARLRDRSNRTFSIAGFLDFIISIRIFTSTSKYFQIHLISTGSENISNREESKPGREHTCIPMHPITSGQIQVQLEAASEKKKMGLKCQSKRLPRTTESSSGAKEGAGKGGVTFQSSSAERRMGKSGQ